MYRAMGDFEGDDAHHVDLSFNETQRWHTPDAASKASRNADSPVSSTAVLLGDEVTGPAVLLFALAPDVSPPNALAHGHAADNWRMSLNGVMPMGRESYAPGEFRFQQGWKPYASDNYAQGPQGGWSALFFSDRRGLRIRPVKPDAWHPMTEMNRLFAEYLGITGDLNSDDPADEPGRGGLATTLTDVIVGAHTNGSFADSAGWDEVTPGTRAVVAVLGEPDDGPVMLLLASDPGADGLAAATFSTDLMRIVVAGSCTVGGTTYAMGDMRVQEAGTPMPATTAGAQGCSEVIMIADRRGVPGAITDGTWAGALEGMLAELTSRLVPA